MKINLTGEHVSFFKECFLYNPESGDLLWKHRPNYGAAWNAKHAGRVAGCKHVVDGAARSVMVRMDLFGRAVCLKAHRIIYSMMNGPLSSSHEIDHKDRNPFNNRLSNLRPSTHAENMHNVRKKKNGNESLPKGVQKHGPSYRASIMVNKRYIRLGVFKTPDEAGHAYMEESKKRMGEFSIYSV